MSPRKKPAPKPTPEPSPLPPPSYGPDFSQLIAVARELSLPKPRLQLYTVEIDSLPRAAVLAHTPGEALGLIWDAVEGQFKRNPDGRSAEHFHFRVYPAGAFR